MSEVFSNTSIQAVKDYWNARPCNIRHSPSEIGTREYFDQVEARKYLVEPHIPAFAEFDRWRGKRVLEIGCGIGTDTINFARAGATVTAVDLSSASIDLARQRAEIFGFSDKIEFVEANAEQLHERIPPQPFDLVYSFGVIHHTPDPRAVVETVRANFVDSGSTLKLMVYNRRSWKVLNMLWSEGFRSGPLDKVIAKHSEAQTGCPITYSYTSKTAATLLEGLFKIDHVAIEHIFPYKIEKYVRYEYEMEWYFKMLPSRLFRSLERSLGWHLCIDASPEQ